MASAESFFRDIKRDPGRYYIIHYSSETLFDPDAEKAPSPRITSIVVRHYQSGQTLSFATHTAAETLGIALDQIEARFDEVEKEMLTQFYKFVRDRRERLWVHWNMRAITFGFEHLEHRYRVLTHDEPPSIPVEVRLNLNDILKARYGQDYAPDPRMSSLMNLNGGLVQGFMAGKDESEAFKAKDYIRMHASTIAKVTFFAHVISLALKGKLKTAGNGIVNLIDRLLESRKARVTVTACTALGGAVALVQGWKWIF
ncbi:hypothetical protein [Propylenella binzhouense]|uniref:Uncharacterized protein n=1 Tax=Propylenella binzhouense TaxID=2555902 RepID=A0A964T9P6_9HYPH|nr:hypothetical protein [Propylenella binzhouense]MYZ49902.1 hypothetical protein [Propylenella binzhouense]